MLDESLTTFFINNEILQRFTLVILLFIPHIIYLPVIVYHSLSVLYNTCRTYFGHQASFQPENGNMNSSS